ncbi:hypothetical protein GC173_08685 [bacterium]|nr:hypothetical protein [bacterium]
MMSPQSREEQHRGVMLAEAFAEYRRRHRFNPAAWVGSGGMIGYMLSYALALVLLASTIMLAVGGVMALVAGVTIFVVVTRRQYGLDDEPWHFLIGLVIVSGTLLLNRLLVVILTKLSASTPRNQAGVPFWVKELYAPRSPWIEQAREILLTGQTGLSILAAHEAERRHLAGKRAFFTGITTVLLVTIVSALTIPKLIPPPVLSLLVGTILTTASSRYSANDRRLRCMDLLYRWDARKAGQRIYSEASAIAACLAGLCICSFLAAMVCAVAQHLLQKRLGETGAGMVLYGAASIIAILTAIELERERKLAPELANLDAAQVNRVFARFVAEEVLADPDAVAASPRVNLPVRTEWQYPWDLLLDLVGARMIRRGM